MVHQSTPVATPAPRTSRFAEAAMNSRSSIHPPPDMLWQDLGIDKLIDQFNEENNAPPTGVRNQAIGAPSTTTSAATPTLTSTTATEGTFGRFSRAVSSFFHGSGFSALGKRKAGAEAASTPAPAPVDDRREQARVAYEQAKELGLLPTPKVFVRPHARPRRRSATSPLAPPSNPPSRLNTPTRTLHKSASKKDLNKQKKLSKRVSNLEHKLSEARRELGLALALKEKENEQKSKDTPPVTPNRPLTPNKTHFSTETESNVLILMESQSHNKITKKRKATEEKAVSIYGDSDVESEHESKKNKKTVTPRRASTRLSKKRSKSSISAKEEVIMVVPDGVSVPPIPSIPAGVEGKRVAVSDDGFGGLSHEIF
ncbi:hypothetical protein K505DRAFT_38926 [Melanomma pulvis-pyrius CBS 109.77]|uniref:Uncharacterized protein n=1 Tax=Melanomma pulvis-pyrius CBS 109.77 TaxID=1314802 RepID=A0A6A6XBY9_9PLEO|nr:hypothetical protein K505DRAFT_38926 [Melanomma pulvis-pyrius CBS 109.77]